LGECFRCGEQANIAVEFKDGHVEVLCGIHYKEEMMDKK